MSEIVWPFTEFWVVSIEYFRRVWHADRGRLLLRTTGPVPLGLACVLLVETNPFPNLSLFFRTMIFEYPSVLSRFCLNVKYKRTDALSLWHQQKSTKTRGETRCPGAASTVNARDTTKVYIWRLDTGCWPTLYRKCHSHNTPGKGILTLELNPSRGTVLPAPHDKGNKCDKNVKYKRTYGSADWSASAGCGIQSMNKSAKLNSILIVMTVKIEFDAFV